MLSRKDYQDIATALSEARMTGKERAALADVLVNVMKRDNIRFNPTKFYIASGVMKPPIEFKLEDK